MHASDLARNIFFDSLAKLRIDEIADAKVKCVEGALTVDGFRYPMDKFDRVVVVSIGKAAGSMWDAMVPIVQSAMNPKQRIEGVVVGPSAPSARTGGVLYFEGGHPLPNQASLDAARSILELLSACGDRCLVLFLISGGSSAMVELAIDPNMQLEDIVGFYRSLVGSGLSIEAMNVLRKHFSAVKGGRLAMAARDATQCTLLISDVPANLLHVVGSGPSLADPSTTQQCRAIIERNRESLRLPPKVLEFFSNSALPETPKAEQFDSLTSHCTSLTSSDDLSVIASTCASKLGFYVAVNNHCDEWEYRRAASYLVDELQRLRRLHARVCLISVGEVSVALPARHGMGGRNQQFVLESARLLHERGFPATVLSGGSDGIDGNSPAAGAVGDQTTWTRATAAGYNASAAIDAFDSFPLFHCLGDAILTGPTGNNVRDLRILLSSE